MSLVRFTTLAAIALAAGCLPIAPTASPSSAATPASPAAAASAPSAPPEQAESPIPEGVPVATIRGEKVGYRRSSLNGNTKDGFTLYMFELEELARIRGEVNASIEGKLEKGKPVPVVLRFLQVGDPKSTEGVRNISSGGCQGEGTLTLETMSPLPKPRPTAHDPEAVGEAKGKLMINVECSFDLKKEFGNFTISGPITATIFSTEARR